MEGPESYKKAAQEKFFNEGAFPQEVMQAAKDIVQNLTDDHDISIKSFEDNFSIGLKITEGHLDADDFYQATQEVENERVNFIFNENDQIIKISPANLN